MAGVRHRLISGVPRKETLLSALVAGSVLCVRGTEAFDYKAFLPQVRVPPDFTITLAAGDPAIRYPMFACFDDAGRLYVAESSGKDLYAGLRNLTRDCQVTRLEDADGDGRFENAVVFADQVTFPMGLAWRDGRLYLADPPELVALTDTDNDGRADRREVILSGFGHTDNGSLHGLTFGPDGRLYFTMGEPDGWKLPRGDGTFLEGVAGALFRCGPDGSRPEVVSRGFVNLVEVEFFPSGEIIGTDNWFQPPAGGYRDALVDCAPAGLYPYAPDRGTPLPRTGIMLPPLSLLPAVAHSGLTRLRLTGFPPDWRDSLFVAEHNTRKVVRSELRRDDSTFAATNSDFVTGEHPDFHPADVVEAPDGSLLVIDTGGWYVEHCPTGRIRDSRAPGGIYRVRWNNAPKDVKPAPGEQRFAAVWRLGVEELLAHLNDPNPEMVCAAIRALASKGETSAAAVLRTKLEAGHPPVRRAAAEALAVCGSRADAPQLVAALVRAGDAFEEHACIAALLAAGDEPFVRSLLEHDTARVRVAALHLLDQAPFSTLRFADLLPALGEAATADAARGLLARHPAWATEALPWLRDQLAVPLEDDAAATAFGSLLEVFQEDPGVRGLVTETLAPDSAAPTATRVLLLRMLPSLSAREPEPEWLAAVPFGLRDPALRAAALEVVNAFPRGEWRPLLTSLAEDPAVPASERLLAARLVSPQPELSDAVFALAEASLAAHAPPADRFAATELLSRTRLTSEQMEQLLARLERDPAAGIETFVPALVRAASDQTRPGLVDFFIRQFASGWSPDRTTLDQMGAAFPGDEPTQLRLMTAWESNRAAMFERLAEFKPLLEGGDPDRGRTAFAKATCLGCHRVGAEGGTQGPDLTRIGAIRSGADLLESILFPSSTFAQGYVPHRLIRKTGEELSGSLASQGPEAVVLRDGAGVLHRVRTGAIESVTRQAVSAMPQGLEQLLTREEFRDLMAFLQSLD